jgi:hypothetical protein
MNTAMAINRTTKAPMILSFPSDVQRLKQIISVSKLACQMNTQKPRPGFILGPSSRS